jgi:hypothetical protein
MVTRTGTQRPWTAARDQGHYHAAARPQAECKHFPSQARCQIRQPLHAAPRSAPTNGADIVAARLEDIARRRGSHGQASSSAAPSPPPASPTAACAAAGGGGSALHDPPLSSPRRSGSSRLRDAIVWGMMMARHDARADVRPLPAPCPPLPAPARTALPLGTPVVLPPACPRPPSPVIACIMALMPVIDFSRRGSKKGAH